MTDVKFPHPLFEGDTVHCTTEVIGKRESKSRPGAGIVEFHHRAYNQDDKLVAECRRQVFMRMRPNASPMRSLLFVPADGGNKLDKAMASGADAVIVDLEDSISPAGKAAARERGGRLLEAVKAAAAPSPAGARQRIRRPASPTPISTLSCRPAPTPSCCRKPKAAPA